MECNLIEYSICFSNLKSLRKKIHKEEKYIKKWGDRLEKSNKRNAYLTKTTATGAAIGATSGAATSAGVIAGISGGTMIGFSPRVTVAGGIAGGRMGYLYGKDKLYRKAGELDDRVQKLERLKLKYNELNKR